METLYLLKTGLCLTCIMQMDAKESVGFPWHHDRE